MRGPGPDRVFRPAPRARVGLHAGRHGAADGRHPRQGGRRVSDAGKGVRRALAFSFIERWLSIIIALGSNVLLARLLSPEQVGIFSVSLSVIGVAQVLRDFGVVNYVIQEKELQQDSLRTAFGLSLLLGGGLFLVVAAAAPAIADFY
ncbi:MAG: hypothetical protein EOP39_27330, partial [Rubrivivax sp.]